MYSINVIVILVALFSVFRLLTKLYSSYKIPNWAYNKY